MIATKELARWTVIFLSVRRRLAETRKQWDRAWLQAVGSSNIGKAEQARNLSASSALSLIRAPDARRYDSSKPCQLSRRRGTLIAIRSRGTRGPSIATTAGSFPRLGHRRDSLENHEYSGTGRFCFRGEGCPTRIEPIGGLADGHTRTLYRLAVRPHSGAVDRAVVVGPELLSWFLRPPLLRIYRLAKSFAIDGDPEKAIDLGIGHHRVVPGTTHFRDARC